MKGCDVIGDGPDEIAAAADAARKADVAIVVLGENEWHAPGKTGTNGEGFDVASLDLTGRQEELLKAVHATGTPTVLVLVNGRPLSDPLGRRARPGDRRGVAARRAGRRGGGRRALRGPRARGSAADHRPPPRGTAAGRLRPQALEGVLDPGRLGQALRGHEPGASLRVRPRALLHALRLREPAPLGLRPSAATGRSRCASTSQNVGKRPGREVVQLYLRDPVASVVVPVQRLRGFEKVALAPGETRTVRFTLWSADLALLDAGLRFTVEPGAFEVAVGSSSRKLPLTGRFEVIP